MPVCLSAPAGKPKTKSEFTNFQQSVKRTGSALKLTRDLLVDPAVRLFRSHTREYLHVHTRPPKGVNTALEIFKCQNGQWKAHQKTQKYTVPIFSWNDVV
ncbi:uncharacterized protein PHALS_03267 [Plasmopara halstedii]|uniref:Uncharacterized protein n=1 Tax=Plasmopara halstedii TaxID=4781 RepID=A0A0P1AZC1_PLAHL|nr:uncharacterized protein PHALS_03267 [Plasmopara halstedii]CEG46660.1 hypothetical protein PHALS_03267 [Plasmopara halstedii]|eukprot:XP_024583029.1 hypothetical protein PHALS_03267 [Plasmopara halstedii]